MPDAVLVSTATRTRETWAGIAPALSGAPAPALVGRLYLATPAIMLDVLRGASGATVAMVGHNPGIAAFAAALCASPPPDPDFARYPTGATLVLDVPVDDWAQLRLGTGTVRDFVVPRALE
jgi:phosphohistidine phosphatase